MARPLTVTIFGSVELDTVTKKISTASVYFPGSSTGDTVEIDTAGITGIGDYGPKKGPVIEKADVYDLDTIVIKIHDLLKKKGPHIIMDNTSVQPGQKGATAATLKMFLTIGGMKVVNISIRYKGSASWASQPSVTGNFTREFSTFFKAKS